jgi:uncharacterized caspase-like protein
MERDLSMNPRRQAVPSISLVSSRVGASCLLRATWLTLLWILTPSSWAIQSSSPVQAAPRFALIVGNGDYAHVTPLRNPQNDAQDMCRTLRGLGYQTFCYTNVTSRAQFRSIVEDFAERLSADTVSLLYYAGHAVQIRGENYLIPTGAELGTAADAMEQSLSLGYVMKQLQSSHALLKIVVIDACRDELSQSSSSSVAAEMAQISITSFPDDSFLLYSTAANGAAMDGLGRNGLLTKNLLAHLRDTGDLEDLFNSVSDRVREESAALGHPQTPEIRRNSGLRFCLLKCTEIEDLQNKKDLAEKEIERLQKSVVAGDRDAKAQLDAEVKYQTQLQAQLEKKTKEREKRSFVTPSF